MRTVYLSFIFCLFTLLGSAQSVKPYLAIVKTTEGKHKGILHKVDSASVILNSDGEFIKIPISSIQTAQIRAIKKGYKSIDLVKIGSDPQEYKVNQRGEMVDKWGHKMPTGEEELTTTFYSAIFTAVANGFALPIHAINPSLAKFRFKGDIAHDKAELEALSLYSVYYQSNPNVLAELDKLKKISAGFKP